MKNLENVETFLLPSNYRKLGYAVMFLGIPLVLALFAFVIWGYSHEAGVNYWKDWGGFVLHIPLSLGLYFILFAREKDEDEMYLVLRLKAMLQGIRFIFMAIIMLPLFANIKNIMTGQAAEVPDIGGNLAVVTLLLLYANATYFYFRSKAQSDEE